MKFKANKPTNEQIGKLTFSIKPFIVQGGPQGFEERIFIHCRAGTIPRNRHIRAAVELTTRFVCDHGIGALEDVVKSIDEEINGTVKKEDVA